MCLTVEMLKSLCYKKSILKLKKSIFSNYRISAHHYHCYLGDMLSMDGDADAAVENRIRTGWYKCRQFEPLLTNKDISLKERGRIVQQLCSK